MQTAENKAAMARDQTDAFLNFMPGQRLRRARELRGMTQEQAGAELNLSLRFIEAIESDNYDVLPGSVFARGYMRSYARLLHLDDNDVVAKFDQALDARRPEPTESRANPIRLLGQVARSPRKQVSRMLWMVSAGMLVMMVAGAFIWSSHESFNPGPALEKIHTHDVTETSTASPSVIA
ncbi:MAG: helix-turn-helix domain-containing protein, partial [Pseudomonadales bacterium]|nr:helix-turn-helix domain-containing protein [Pseudomonadales bacterium]